MHMTTMPRWLKNSGYRTAFVGKWDAGMATYAHTPSGRGFEASLGYFTHRNDYWDQSSPEVESCNHASSYRDLWYDTRPAADVPPSYAEHMFLEAALVSINNSEGDPRPVRPTCTTASTPLDPRRVPPCPAPPCATLPRFASAAIFVVCPAHGTLPPATPWVGRGPVSSHRERKPPQVRGSRARAGLGNCEFNRCHPSGVAMGQCRAGLHQRQRRADIHAPKLGCQLRRREQLPTARWQGQLFRGWCPDTNLW